MPAKNHVCPVDKRRFASKAALSQHRNASHCEAFASAPAKAAPRRANRARRVEAGGNSSMPKQRMSGTDIVFIRSNISTATPVGSVLASFDMMPGFFTKTRLAATAELWARWKPHNLTMRVLSSAGSMTSGSYVVGWTPDINLQLNEGTDAVISVGSMRPSVTANIHQSTAFKVPTEMTQRWYLLDSHDRGEEVHGKVFVVLTAPIGNITGDSKISLTFKLEYVVEFEGAVLSRPSVEAEIYADDGWEGYHTTSYGSWNEGKSLSLKHTAGGNLVPFSKAQPGIVYELSSSATLPYQKADGSTGKITHGVIIPELGGKHFAVFSSKTEAEAYIASGYSVDKTLPYKAAGNTVSPSNPPWTPQRVSSLSSRDSELITIRAQVSGLAALLERLELKLEGRERGGSLSGESTASEIGFHKVDLPSTSKEGFL